MFGPPALRLGGRSKSTEIAISRVALNNHNNTQSLPTHQSLVIHDPFTHDEHPRPHRSRKGCSQIRRGKLATQSNSPRSIENPAPDRQNPITDRILLDSYPLPSHSHHHNHNPNVTITSTPITSITLTTHSRKNQITRLKASKHRTHRAAIASRPLRFPSGATQSSVCQRWRAFFWQAKRRPWSVRHSRQQVRLKSVRRSSP